VEDNPTNQKVAAMLLRQDGHAVDVASDGAAALELVDAGDYDVVLMDVQMPVMDGLTATRWIRRELGLTELPIIAFTAGVRDDQQAAARAAGANDVLAKPMDLDQMA
ncbi:response regulator, partial [Acinetobacter baumannii]